MQIIVKSRIVSRMKRMNTDGITDEEDERGWPRIMADRHGFMDNPRIWFEGWFG